MSNITPTIIKIIKLVPQKKKIVKNNCQKKIQIKYLRIPLKAARNLIIVP